MSDPRWFDYSSPVHAFLAQPRDWTALTSWRKRNKMGRTRFHNCLAWLELNGYATSGWTEDGRVYWVQPGNEPSGSRKREKLPTAEEPGNASGDEPGTDGSDEPED